MSFRSGWLAGCDWLQATASDCNTTLHYTSYRTSNKPPLAYAPRPWMNEVDSGPHPWLSEVSSLYGPCPWTNEVKSNVPRVDSDGSDEVCDGCGRDNGIVMFVFIIMFLLLLYFILLLLSSLLLLLAFLLLFIVILLVFLLLLLLLILLAALF